LIATGSPFPPITRAGRSIRIGQCNNAFIFPGVGLGVITSGARRVTDGMFSAAASVLSEFSPALRNPMDALYPSLESVREISYQVALAVGAEAIRAGLSRLSSVNSLEVTLANKMWLPRYVPLTRSTWWKDKTKRRTRPLKPRAALQVWPPP